MALTWQSSKTEKDWKKDFLQWGQIQEEKGVMVAASKEQEWLLPWWWQNYTYYNQEPVIFVDFGMSPKAKKWCQKKGYVAVLPEIPENFKTEQKPVDLELIKKWQIFFGDLFFSYFSCRSFLFKKPLALLKTVFKKTIWLDLDCEVRDSLAPLFKQLKRVKLGAVKNSKKAHQRHYLSGLQPKNAAFYNSGVVMYQHGTALILKWAQASFEKTELFCTDDQLLSHLVFQKKETILNLPRTYNWLLSWGENAHAKVTHYVGATGKKRIKELMKKLSKLPFVQADWSFK